MELPLASPQSSGQFRDAPSPEEQEDYDQQD
jgi:hypothetical protein